MVPSRKVLRISRANPVRHIALQDTQIAPLCFAATEAGLYHSSKHRTPGPACCIGIGQERCSFLCDEQLGVCFRIVLLLLRVLVPWFCVEGIGGVVALLSNRRTQWLRGGSIALHCLLQGQATSLPRILLQSEQGEALAPAPAQTAKVPTHTLFVLRSSSKKPCF